MMCKEGDSRNIMNFLYIEKYYWSKSMEKNKTG